MRLSHFLLAALLLPNSFARAQIDAETAPNFISDNSAVLFVRLDLAKLDLEQIDALLKSHLDQPEFDRHSRAALDRWSHGITSTLAELKRLGVHELCLIGSLEFLDFHLDPFLESPQDFVYVVIPHKTSLDTAAIAKAFGTKMAERPETANLSPRDDRARRWIAIECNSGNQQPQRWFTVIGPQRLLARVVRDRAQPRSDVVAALKIDTPLQIALVPPPVFGKAFAEIVGPAIIDSVDAVNALAAFRSASLGIPPKPDGQWHFAIRASDAAAANGLRDLLATLPKAVSLLKPRTPLVSFATLLASLDLKTDGDRVSAQGSLSVGSDAEQALRTLLSESLLAVARQQTAQKMREIVVAINNHIDSYKTLPMTAGFSSKDGKPLLSWRVKLLPYLDQGNLYNEFRKDEPWDSVHNKMLIDRMPEIYRRPFGDPNSTKTLFVLPVGKETAYPGGRELTIREIRDGTSKTIGLIIVAPEHEVIWTKPEDWEIDWDDPTKGLDFIGDRTGVAYLDAGWRFISRAESRDDWRRILSAAGNEVNVPPEVVSP